MKKKNFSIIVFTLVFFVAALSVYSAQKQTDKTVEGKIVPNLNGKIVMKSEPGCYVSPLTYDTNGKNHQTIFTHNLGVVPHKVIVYFTPGNGDYFPVIQRWMDFIINPVTIRVTASHIILNITAEGYLFAAWDAQNGQWTGWNSGYWYVVCE